MDIHYLRMFNIMASELNYSKAANTLYITQPAVSMQIRKLENDLGFRLFDKIGKHLYLNENGKILYEYTKKIFALIEEAENSLYSRNNIVKGTVDIGASNTPGTYVLPKILGEFKEMYPDVNTYLHIANTHEIERMIFDNKVDFAVNGGDIEYSSQIVTEKLADDSVVFITSPSNSLAGCECVEPCELADSKFITHERNSQVYKLIEDILKELGLPVNITVTLGNIEAIKQAVAANLGIAAIPGSAISMEMKFGVLKQFRIKGKQWIYPYNLIYHKNRLHSNQAAKLMALVKERMKTFS